ncbi:cation-efflux pump [Deltaproteobacteria bacterium Smac51]|nr:cation-efflux pump [Deltaproteobacteria bacterium Smac51]
MNDFQTINSRRSTLSGEDGNARKIARVTWVGVVVNVVLTALKAVGGVLAGSRALVADAVHSLSDLATDAAVIIGVRYWTAPADREHPYGHQKIETLITLAIGLALAGVGVGLGFEAVKNLFQAYSGHRDIHTPEISGATWLALGAALASLVSKEILYRWTAAQGRALGSSAVVANAWHHRSDAFSSIPPAISIGAGALGARFGYDLWFLDPIGTIAVCLLLLKGAWDVVRPTFSPLLDARADRELCHGICECVLATPGVISTHKIRTRCLCAGEVAVDLHILVDGSLSVTEGHDLASLVKYAILDLRVEGVEARAVDVVVHVEPCPQASA